MQGSNVVYYTPMIGTIMLIAGIGAVVALVVGSIWYSPGMPMGRLHMKAIGFDKLSPDEQKRLIEEMKPKMWKSYLLQFIMSVLISFFIGFITVVGMQNGQTFGAVVFETAFVWLALGCSTRLHKVCMEAPILANHSR